MSIEALEASSASLAHALRPRAPCQLVALPSSSSSCDDEIKLIAVALSWKRESRFVIQGERYLPLSAFVRIVTSCRRLRLGEESNRMLRQLLCRSFSSPHSEATATSIRWSGWRRALAARGHRVKVLTNPYLQDVVAGAGVELVPMGSRRRIHRSHAAPRPMAPDTRPELVYASAAAAASAVRAVG